MEELTPRFIDSLVGMRCKEVPLRLQQIRRPPLAAVPVIKSKRGRKRRHWHPNLDRMDDRLPPGRLVFAQRVREEIIHQQILQLRILIKCLLDISQEHAANNASATPHQRSSP